MDGGVPYSCADLMEEAVRLLDEVYSGAARLIFNRVVETCLDDRQQCPAHRSCRLAVERVGHRLSETNG